MIRLAVTALAAALVGAYVVEGTPKKVRTPEEEAAWQAERARRFYVRNGGFVVQPQAEKKCVALVNVGGVADPAALEDVASGIKSFFQFPAMVTGTRPSNAGVVIEFKDDNTPAVLLTAPENGFATVNVRLLKADGPDGEKLKARFVKEAWRAFVYLLGGGNDTQPGCLMKPVSSLASLDGLSSATPCPMMANAVANGAAMFGIRPERTVTYRQACQEGWAPAPTNDVQKAIWDKVHAIPQNPMKIEFDPKKGR